MSAPCTTEDQLDGVTPCDYDSMLSFLNSTATVLSEESVFDPNQENHLPPVDGSVTFVKDWQLC